MAREISMSVSAYSDRRYGSRSHAPVAENRRRCRRDRHVARQREGRLDRREDMTVISPGGRGAPTKSADLVIGHQAGGVRVLTAKHIKGKSAFHLLNFLFLFIFLINSFLLFFRIEHNKKIRSLYYPF